MANLSKDLKFAFRLSVKNPVFSLVVILSLALGIGANTTIFTFINAIFLNPLNVERGHELVSLFTTDEHNQNAGFFGSNLPVSYPNYEDYRDKNEVFTGLAAYSVAGLSLSGAAGAPEMIPGEMVTGNYFELLGLAPAAGRFFLPEEDSTPGAYPVAVISHSLWQRRFGGETSVIGQTLILNRQAFTVIGVAPRGFSGIFALGSTDIWVPTMMYGTVLTGVYSDFFQSRRALLFSLVGRLKPGVSLEQAEANVQATAAGLQARYPVDNKGRSAVLLPLALSTIPSNLRAQMVQAGTVLMTVVGLILLISCANVANLLLSRAASRGREIAVRLSLGASRARLVRQLLTESVLLAVAGGLAGLLLAGWARGLLWASRPPFLGQAVLNLGLDVQVLGFTLLLSVLTGILFGLVPALQASRADLTTALKEEAAPAGQTFRRFSFRNLLVVSQVALSLVSLVGAGLFLRSLSQAQEIDPGFEPSRLLIVNLDLGTQGYNPAQGLEFYRRAAEEVAALPGVSMTAFSQSPPLGGAFMRSVYLQGSESRENDSGRLTMVSVVGEGYFQAAGIPLLRGRDFQETDRTETPPVAIINQTMAERFWPGREAIGQHFLFYGSDTPVEVVGIARDSKYATLGEPPQPFIYQPLGQNYSEQMSLFVRSESNPDPLLVPVQKELNALDPDLALGAVNTVQQLIDQSLWAPRMGAGLLGAFGLLALLLAAVGIYGVMAYAVNQRSHEIGIRLALGAGRPDIVRMVLVQGMAMAAAGVGIGLLLALMFSGQMSALLWVSARDPLTYAMTVAVLAGVALLANLFPARRATAITPMLALRGMAQRG